MSTPIPSAAGASRRANVVVQLREAFVALNGQVVPHLTQHGHQEVRAAHGAVFQYLDQDGHHCQHAGRAGPDDQAGDG